MPARKNEVLHITPHLGGGVGKVLLNYLITEKNNAAFEHVIACLDYANKNAIKVASDSDLKLFGNIAKNKQKLLAMLAKADIVLLHWWNHPLLYDFLVRNKLPPCRLILWSHISGFHPPYVFSEKIFQYSDLFVFTTPLSLKTREVEKLGDEQKKKLSVIWSTGGVEDVKLIKQKKHSGFNIGYIGTVDYVKLHPNFLNICNKIDIPDVKFIVCGGPSEKEIKREAEKLGIDRKFEFTGFVTNIFEYLSIFDVFGYPLAPYHYGTCDQVLAESMAAGVVPVVLQNPMEKYMIKNKVTGIVAKSEYDYIKAIHALYKDKILRNVLSRNARNCAIKTFSINKMAREWDEVFLEALTIPKTYKKWSIKKRDNEISAMDVFLESIGDYGKEYFVYCNATSDNEKKLASKKIKVLAKSINWQAKTRGTVHHYNSFFPDDQCLSRCSELMRINNISKKYGC